MSKFLCWTRTIKNIRFVHCCLGLIYIRTGLARVLLNRNLSPQEHYEASNGWLARKLKTYLKSEFGSHFFFELPDLFHQVEALIFLHLADRILDRIDNYAALVIKQRTMPRYVFVYLFPLHCKLLRKHFGRNDMEVGVQFQKCRLAVVNVKAFGEF